MLRKAELSGKADSENYLGGSSETICTTQDLTITRGVGQLGRNRSTDQNPWRPVSATAQAESKSCHGSVSLLPGLHRCARPLLI